jgi:hypothetical protein
MEIVPSLAYSLAFTAVFFVLVFSYAAYREKKQAEVERLLIEQGKADAVLEMRRLRQQSSAEWFSGRKLNPSLPVAIGVAAIVSGGILYATGLGPKYNAADVWFVIFGIFGIAWGIAAALSRPRV